LPEELAQERGRLARKLRDDLGRRDQRLELVPRVIGRRLAQDACPADQRGDAADRQRIRIWRGDPRP